MASCSPQVLPEDPKFIRYLFDPDTTYKCYFIVGNSSTNRPVETIGVVKKMLLSHSEVFRRELQESIIKEKNNVVVTDIFPDTFKNLLRFVYGHDITANLSFDDSDDLLYAAEKYYIESLRDSVSARLIDLLNVDKICSLLNNPACFKPLELKAAMSKILQYETSKVLSSPEFLNLSPLALLNILKQPLLNVPELDIWRSALKWAKKRAGTDDGPTLRTELSTPLQHIRLCSLTTEDVCKEVVKTKVLTDSEALLVLVSVSTKEKQPELTSICNEVQCRQPSINQFTKSEVMEMYLPLHYCLDERVQESVVTLTTKGQHIELSSLTLYLASHQSGPWTYPKRCTVTIEGPTLSETNCVTDSPITIQHNRPCRAWWDVDVSNNGKAVVLQPNSEYTITLRCDEPFDLYKTNSFSLDGSHLTVQCVTYQRTIVSVVRYKVLSNT